ncbi:MAG: hypothetical protein HOW73_20235 [Polyangiaceae bacterium]|nr:hypothetical protein [Polyangiaceae bacterium]
MGRTPESIEADRADDLARVREHDAYDCAHGAPASTVYSQWQLANNDRKFLLAEVARLTAALEQTRAPGTPALATMKTEPPAEQRFYVISLKYTRDQVICWWQPDANGYTNALDYAGTYALEEIDSKRDYYDDGKNALAIPVDWVTGLTRTVVDSAHLRSLVAKRREADNVVRVEEPSR